MLPSHLLAQGDTIDILVNDVALTWEKYHRDQQDAKNGGAKPSVPNIPLNKLQDMINRVRER